MYSSPFKKLKNKNQKNMASKATRVTRAALNKPPKKLAKGPETSQSICCICDNIVYNIIDPTETEPGQDSIKYEGKCMAT